MAQYGIRVVNCSTTPETVVSVAPVPSDVDLGDAVELAAELMLVENHRIEIELLEDDQ